MGESVYYESEFLCVVCYRLLSVSPYAFSALYKSKKSLTFVMSKSEILRKICMTITRNSPQMQALSSVVLWSEPASDAAQRHRDREL